MRRIQLWHGFAALVTLCAVGVRSEAQGPYQPPISPYINILRGGAPAAVNYFNIVQPQMAFNDAIGQLQIQQGNLSAAMASGTGLGSTTGHPIMFGNYSHYYNPRGVASMGGGGMGGMGAGGFGMGMGGGMAMGGMGGGMGMGGMGGGMGMGGMGGGMGGMGGMNMGGMGGGMGGMNMGGMGR